MAFRFLPSILQSKAAKEPDQNEQQAISRAIGINTGMRWNENESSLLRYYERIIWVYRCVDAIASNIAALPMYLGELDQDGEYTKVAQPDWINLFNRRANFYESAVQFRYRLSSQLLLSRKGVFIERVNSASGDPAALHLLPINTEPIKDPRTFVSGYRVTSSSGTEILPPERVIWIRAKPHPTDAYAQMTPLVAAGIAADTDYLARVFNANFLRNDGKPGLIVGVSGQLAPEDRDDLKKRFNGGPARAGETTVIEADNLSLADLTSNPHDIQWRTAIEGSKDDIMLAFGTPESVLGNASGRTFDNADAEAEVWWTSTNLPHAEAISNGFDSLTGDTNDTRVLKHDFSGVYVIQRHQRERHEKMFREVQAGLISVDDYLEGTGRERINVPGTRVLWMPAGKLAVGPDQETTDAAEQYQAVGPPAMPGMPGAGGGFPVAPGGAVGGFGAPAGHGAGNGGEGFTTDSGDFIELEQLSAPQDDIDRELLELTMDRADGMASEKKGDLPDPYYELRTKAEAQVEAALTSWSRRQEKMILSRLKGNARKGTRHWEGEGTGDKALPVDAVIDTEFWIDEAMEDIEPIVKAVVDATAESVADDLDENGIIEVLERVGIANSLMPDPLSKMVPSRMERETLGTATKERIYDYTRASIQRQTDMLKSSIAAWDIEEQVEFKGIVENTRKRLRSRTSWIKNLAINIVTSALEGTKQEILDHAGPYVQKTWHTQLDEKVRDTHRLMEGKTIQGHQRFRVGTGLLEFPGDPTGPLGEVINCRCWLSWSATSSAPVGVR